MFDCGQISIHDWKKDEISNRCVRQHSHNVLWLWRNLLRYDLIVVLFCSFCIPDFGDDPEAKRIPFRVFLAQFFMLVIQ